MDEINKERNMQSDREYDSRSGQVSGKSWSAGHWRVWCSASVSRPACTTRRRFRAQANGWINVENPHLARALHRFSKARNSIRLVLDHSHLLSSRMRGLREILAHPAKKPMGHPMPSELTLSVNGAKHQVSVAPETPLLFVLRNELKLTGPHLGCGMAQCGACAVLLDGEEVRTCITPVSFAVGKQVTTIEGLPAVWAEKKGLNAADAAKTLHPIQQAWIDEQVPQFGYCQSGMMIAAAQLLAKNPNPTVAQIKDAFTNTPPSPHLCRCGTYAVIIDT